MTTPQAIAVLTTQEAVERLLARGWTREKCPSCYGLGAHPIPQPDDTPMFSGAARQWGRICEVCAGGKVVWREPI